MSARATRPLKDGEGELKLSVNAGYVSISSAPTINAPEEFEKHCVAAGATTGHLVP